jgi:glutamate dehydrogenase (NADP+)
VPAGDIGVGGREIGYMFGQYKRIRNEFTGVLTGKGLAWGGSLIRPEATGYGCVYFAEKCSRPAGEDLQGKTCTVSGSGNVAQYTVEKLNELGAKVVTLSDSGGTIHDKDGIDPEKLAWVMELKNVKRGRISEYAAKFPRRVPRRQEPLGHPLRLRLPRAPPRTNQRRRRQNARQERLQLVAEGANMPTMPEASTSSSRQDPLRPRQGRQRRRRRHLRPRNGQNSMRLSWTREEVDQPPQGHHVSIHQVACETAKEYGAARQLRVGANIAGFVKVADAMLAQGLILAVRSCTFAKSS